MAQTLADVTPIMKIGTVNADIGGKGEAGSPSYLELVDTDGVSHYLFVETDGTVKVHTAVPTQDSDGSEVGGQS